DLDDLRFFNKALVPSEICGTLARGFVDVNARCVALSPGFEIDFELNRVFDTGLWDLPLAIPQATSFVTTKTGTALRLPSTQAPWGYTSGFLAQVTALPPGVGRSFSFRFDASVAAFGNLINMSHSCAVGAPPVCGISVAYSNLGHLAVFTGSSANFQKT